MYRLPRQAYFLSQTNVFYNLHPVYFNTNYLIIIIIINIVTCEIPSVSGTSLELAVIPTAQASIFTLQCFPYYV